MSAPTNEAPPAAEPPTQPLPISQTLPRGGNWLMSEHSGLLVPAIPVAAWVVGEFLVRPYLALTGEARSDFAIAMSVFVLVFVVGAGFLFARVISRGKDGRS